MLTTSQKRNIKNRAYRQRKQFNDNVLRLPEEIVRIILDFSPIGKEITDYNNDVFLQKNIDELNILLKSADTKQIYFMCTQGLLRHWLKNDWEINYYMKYHPYSKYDSFPYIPEHYDYWMNGLEMYYKIFSNNCNIHKVFQKNILDLLHKNRDNHSLLRKQILAVKISL